MITQFEVDKFINIELPALTMSYKSGLTASTFPARTAIQHLSDYTLSEIRDCHINNVKHCFALADRLYWQGDLVVRMLVENLFVYSLSVYLPYNVGTGDIWPEIMPGQLRKLFSRQQISNCC